MYIALEPPLALPRPEQKTTLSLRYRRPNANHHLWCNHGVWFIHYTVHCPRFIKERIRYSLNTKSIRLARERRDSILAGVEIEPGTIPDYAPAATRLAG